MLARIDLPRVTTTVQRLEEPLPAGPFDVVVSALAVHHLDATAKRDLFARVHAALRAGGRFVLGDVVLVDAAGCAALAGLGLAGHRVRPGQVAPGVGPRRAPRWAEQDLALFVADRP